VNERFGSLTLPANNYFFAFNLSVVLRLRYGLMAPRKTFQKHEKIYNIPTSDRCSSSVITNSALKDILVAISRTIYIYVSAFHYCLE
jgi:hypothetical protein